jgi:hypothetical protein
VADAELVKAIKTFAPADPRDLWRHRSAPLIAAMLLDGVEEPSPDVASLAEFMRAHNLRQQERDAAWRVLTRGNGAAFTQATGAFLAGNETGEISAFYTTQNPAHEATLATFLQADLRKVINMSLAGYAMVGLLRTNTPTGRDSVLSFLKMEGADSRRALRALGHVVHDVQQYLDVETLPGLFQVYEELATAPDAAREVGQGINRVLENLNGLGMTPARRRRVRSDLLALLQATNNRTTGTYAISALQLVGTPEDIEAIEQRAQALDLEGLALTATSFIKLQSPETWR